MHVSHLHHLHVAVRDKFAAPVVRLWKKFACLIFIAVGNNENTLTTKIFWSMVEYPDYKILLIPTTQSSHVVWEWDELRCEVINNGVCILHVLPLPPALTQVALQLEASWRKQSDKSFNNGLLATFPDRRGNRKASIGVNSNGIFLVHTERSKN